MSRGRGAAWVVVVAPTVLACGSSCPGFCLPHDVTVTVTGEVGIASLVVGDSACSGAPVACSDLDDAGACLAFEVDLPRDGNCHLDVLPVDGTHFTDIAVP